MVLGGFGSMIYHLGAVSQEGPDGGELLGDRAAAYMDVAGSGSHLASGDPEGRRLAGSADSQEAKALAALDAQPHAPEGLDWPLEQPLWIGLGGTGHHQLQQTHNQQQLGEINFTDL
eukprot:scaffold128702_cov49-Prasinocladus_malaysianus.AAC.1